MVFNSTSLPDQWSAQVEQIKLITYDKGIRVVGLIACEPHSGTTSLAHALAHINAAAAITTLLIDASQHEASPDITDLWSDIPTQFTTSPRISEPFTSPPKNHNSSPTNYDVLRANPSIATRDFFNNVEALRQLVQEDYADHQAVIIDLPPTNPNYPLAINPISGAAACDGVLLVCMSGRLRRDSLYASCAMLQSSGANVLGIVTNEQMNPTLGAELAREAQRLHRISPKLSEWLTHKALSIRFLN